MESIQNFDNHYSCSKRKDNIKSKHTRDIVTDISCKNDTSYEVENIVRDVILNLTNSVILSFNKSKGIRRCIGVNQFGKPCRTRLKDINSDTYFCCNDHKPKNFDNVIEQCCICCDEVEVKEVIILQCGHAHHRECFAEWNKAQNMPSCSLCKQPLPRKLRKRKKRNKYIYNYNEPMVEEIN